MFTRSIATWPTAALVLLGLTVVSGPLTAQETTDADPSAVRTAPVRPAIIIDADRNFYDLRSGVTRFEDNVSIQRGAMAVEADRGTIRQADGQITEVELEGRPSTWQDRLEDGSVVTGEARTIHFDVLANVVTLTGNAIIRHEQGEFTGDELVYDLTAESLAGRSTGNERVRVVIEPDAMSGPGPATEDRGPETGAGTGAESSADRTTEPPDDATEPAADEAASNGPATDADEGADTAADDSSAGPASDVSPTEEPATEEPAADDPPGDGRTMPDPA